MRLNQGNLGLQRLAKVNCAESQFLIALNNAGLSNLFKLYLPLADHAVIMNNSDEESENRFIARKRFNHDIEIRDMETWEKMKGAAK